MSESVVRKFEEDLKGQKSIPSGTVIRFLVIAPNQKPYTYAGVFAAGQWNFTGNSSLIPKTMTHAEFVRRISENTDAFSYIGVATEFLRVDFGR